jgi:hypothetical protein
MTPRRHQMPEWGTDCGIDNRLAQRVDGWKRETPQQCHTRAQRFGSQTRRFIQVQDRLHGDSLSIIQVNAFIDPQCRIRSAVLCSRAPAPPYPEYWRA